VRPGDTIESLSHKYGVPVAAIKRANGFTYGSVIHPGQHVVIPRYSYGSVVASGPAYGPTTRPPPHSVAGGAPAVLRGPRGASASSVHIVQPHETLISIARRHGKTVAEIASANHIAPYTMVKVGERIIIPGSSMASSVKPTAPSILPPASQKFADNEHQH